MSYKVIAISNPGTSIKFGGDDEDLKSKLLNGVVSGIPAVTIKSSNKWGFWDNILWVENQAATKKTTIRGQANSPSTDVDLALPPTTTNDTLAAIGLQNVFSVKQELDAGTLFKEMTEPSTPSSGFLHLYMEGGHLKRKNSAGAVTDYDNIAAGIPINFPDLSVKLRNPADTFDMTLKHAAISAARQLNMPLITATDTLVTLGLSQIFTDLIVFKKDSSTNIALFRDNNANGSQIGLNFDAKNSATTQTTFARLRGEIEDNTAGSEDGNMLLYLKKAGSDLAVATFKNNYFKFSGISLDIQSTAGLDEVMQLINPINTVGEAAGLNFNLFNSSDAETNYGSMYCAIVANTAGAVSSRFSFWARQAGVARNVFQIQSDGRLDCGGINRRVQLAETNLTAARTFTFPNADTTLAGINILNVFTIEQLIRYDTSGPLLTLHRPANTVTNASRFDFSLNNASSAEKIYSRIMGEIVANTAGAEDGTFKVQVAKAGTLTTGLTLTKDLQLKLPGSALLDGGYQENRVSKVTGDSPYTALQTDSTIDISAASGAFTLNLPAAASNVNKVYTIFRTDLDAAGTGNDVTIDANSTETIDGNLTWKLQTGEKVRLISNGSNWLVTEHSTPNNWGYFYTKGATFNRRYCAGVQQSRSSLSTSTTSPAANTLWALPFIVSKVTKFDTISFNITTAQGSQNARAGIYTDTGTCYPQDLIFDTGSISTGTTGVKDTTITASLQTFQPGLYWLAWETSATTCQIRIIGNTSSQFGIFGYDSTLSTTGPGYGYSVAHTYGALPNPYSGGATTLTADPAVGAPVPAIALRAA